MHSNLYEKDKLILQEFRWEQDESITHSYYNQNSWNFYHTPNTTWVACHKKIHFIWSPIFLVMKMTITTNIENLIWKSIFTAKTLNQNMTYYRSTAQRISQGFQKVFICYFTNFLWFTMHFPKSAKTTTNQALEYYSHESMAAQITPWF
jgi:hypothetical protein